MTDSHTLWTSLRQWWADDRPLRFHWRDWYFGWHGNGWNGLHFGPVTWWFASGPSPRERLRRRLGRV